MKQFLTLILLIGSLNSFSGVTGAGGLRDCGADGKRGNNLSGEGGKVGSGGVFNIKNNS